MPIDRKLDADLSKEDVCEWLQCTDKSYNDKEYLTDEMLANDYTAAKIPEKEITIQSANNSVLLHTFEQTIYRVKHRKSHRYFADLKGVRCYQHDVGVGSKAKLFYINNLSQNKKSIINSAFDDFSVSPGSLRKDISKIENDLVLQGISIDDYYVKLFFTLQRLGNPKEKFNSNDNLLSVIAGERGKYEYKKHKSFTTCEMQNYVIDDDYISDVDCIDKRKNCNADQQIKDSIEGKAKKKTETEDCNGLITKYTRIGTLYQYPEWRTDWITKWVKVGRCSFFKMKLPVVKHRTTKRAVYAYTSSPSEVDELFKTKLEDCVTTASVITGLIALISGGIAFKVAVAAWSSAFLTCIEKFLETTVECIVHDIVLITEKGKWRTGI